VEYWAGVDIGGTKTHAIAVTERGEIVAEVRRPTGFGAVAVVDSVVAVLEHVASMLGIDAAEFAGIGIGVPGAVEAVTGTVCHALNIGVERLELAESIRHRSGVFVTVENDVKAAALGAARQLNHSSGALAYLNLGTGLAAGLVLGGRLWRGGTGIAGEIGHIPIDPQGHLCACGQRGCLETTASGAAVARQWPTRDGSAINALLEAVENGDPAARRVLDRVADHVAIAVKVLVLTVDAESVVLGGGLSSAGDRLREQVAISLDRDSESSGFLASLRLSSRVGIVPDVESVGALGAALVGSGALLHSRKQVWKPAIL
jgi:glucokinase